MIQLNPFELKNWKLVSQWVKNEREMVQFSGPIFNFPIDQKQFENYLLDKIRDVYQVETGSGKIIGICEITHENPETAKLARILIGEKDFRGKGFGVEIVQKLIEIAKNQDKKAILLNVYSWNTIAINLYQKLGFEPSNKPLIMSKVGGEIWETVEMVLTKGPDSGLSKHLFTSERLGFRNWKSSDVSKMIQINRNKKVMEFFPAIPTKEQTQEFIGKMKRTCNEDGFCYFAVDYLETDEFIGFIGLMPQNYPAPFTPCIDIGWRLSPKFWNFGLATEGAKRCLEYAFNELGLTEVVATAPQINKRSIQVMEKIGMKPWMDFEHPSLDNHELLKQCVCYLAKRKDYF